MRTVNLGSVDLCDPASMLIQAADQTLRWGPAYASLITHSAAA